MESKNYKSYLLGYFVIFGIIITLLSSLISYKTHLDDINDSIAGYAQAIAKSRKQYIIEPNINLLDNIVTAAAHDQILQDYIIDASPIKKKVLENLFLTLTKANTAVMQMRFIDATGQEVIRINRDNEQSLPYIVSDALQDKESRKYFQIISKMTTQKIWHSALDLNIENGKIEIPYRPTLRIAMPLFKENKFAGMVICNMLSYSIINAIKGSPLFDIFIIDKDGYYILHPNSKYSWNKYTGEKRLLYEDFPNISTEILSGHVKETNFFTFPLDSIINNDDKAKLVIKPKKSMVDSMKYNNFMTALVIALLSIFVSIPLAIYASRFPLKLQQEIHDKNIQLQRFSDIIDKYVITSTLNLDGIITNASTAFANISGFSKNELINQNMNIIRHSDMKEEVCQDLWTTVIESKQWNGEIKCKTKTGGFYWVEQTIFPIKSTNNAMTSIMSISVDITAKKELETLAITDKLTNLFNRRKIDEALSLKIEKSKRYQNHLSVILIDIDHFKNVNDTYGHQVGDSVLIELAKLLRLHTRKIDICGRFGGEEFIIICPETGKDGAITLAEQLRKIIADYRFEEVNHLTISLGVSVYTAGDDIQTLFKKCDDALYEAKSLGRNKTVFL